MGFRSFDFWCFSAALFVAAAFPAVATSQSITLSGLSANTEVGEGDDFATQELNNPWDMNQAWDIGWTEGMTNISANAGTWSAQNQTQGAYLFPLFPGFKGTIPSEAPQDELTAPRQGMYHPIDAARYDYLCYQANIQPSSLAVYWENDLSKPTAWPDGSNFGASADGWYVDAVDFSSPFIPRTGTHIRCFDLSNLPGSFQQFKGTWSGSVHALRFDPSLSAGAGAASQFNWVRLVRRNSAPTINFSWSTNDGNPRGVRVLYADRSASGHGGVPLAYFRTTADPRSYALPTAVLPPGDWYFYIKSQAYNGNGTPSGNPVYSNYSARLRIRSRATLKYLSPTEYSGEEYWTSIGNPLDMNDAADVINLEGTIYPQVLRQFIYGSFQSYPEAQDGKIFQGLAEPPSLYPPQLETDAQVHFPIDITRPIDPRKYCHLTYRVAADMSQYTDFPDWVRRGGVMRPVAWRTRLFDGEWMDPGAHILYPGYNQYTMDLCKLTTLDGGIFWKDISVVRGMRLDPLETSIYNWFFIDWVKLTGENYSNGSFTIQYSLSGGNAPFRVDFYRDNDRSGTDGTLIGTQSGLSQGNHSFNWNTAGLADGSSYYVYAVVTDAFNQHATYSPVKVFIGAYRATIPLARKAQFDYDGDGKSDRVVLRRGQAATRTCRRDRRRRLVCTTTAARNGEILANGSKSGLKSFTIPGGGFLPVAADIDGDATTDFGHLIAGAGNILQWNIMQSAFNGPYIRNFGLAGDLPVVADWNGNGIDEVGVFRNGEWFILNEVGSVIYVVWGQAGDIPNPADFDGDGRPDLTVYRPSLGQWLVFQTRTGTLLNPSYGLNGDIPVAADYDGDGKADFAVYRPAYGFWVIKPSSGAPDIVVQWGLAEDQPKRGLDFDGDGIPELTVYRPSNGFWYTYNIVTKAVEAVQWGLPGDFTPSK